MPIGMAHHDDDNENGKYDALNYIGFYTRTPLMHYFTDSSYNK